MVSSRLAVHTTTTSLELADLHADSRTLGLLEIRPPRGWDLTTDSGDEMRACTIAKVHILAKAT